MECRICRSVTNPYGHLQLLAEHDVQFFHCAACGFMQTEEPYWLEQAYSAAIACQDVGILYRNERCTTVTAAILRMMFPDARHALDFGGGHGIFVRMMRDRGFDFHWTDLYAKNDYSRGFEFDPSIQYDFLTAFEVLEHFADPMMDLERIMQLSPNVLFSTEVLPEPAPALDTWWYFSPSTGQHVSFYSRRALEAIARHFNRHLLSHGAFHLFTEKPCSGARFRLAARPKVAKIINRVEKRPSLIAADFERLSGRPLS